MTDVKEKDTPHDKALHDPGEHPLSILLFSWMRGKMFPRMFALLLFLAGSGAIAFEVWILRGPVKDVTAAPGFYAGFGFLAFAFVVLAGWPLGKLLRRSEDYYDRRSGEAGRDR